MRVSASCELMASRPEAWAFLAEPYHLPDWWPGVAGVQPDRRGAAAGARWQVVRGSEPTLFKRPEATGMLLVTAADPPRLFAFHLVGERLDVRVELEATTAERTRAAVTVEGPWLIAFRRTLARRAVNRLYALCQTAAALGD
jgi:Polyketide cyclase / dehydrase and lipid transport